MSDFLMLHGVLNMPLPDDPAEIDVVTWVQFKQRAREASARIAELEDVVNKLWRRQDSLDTFNSAVNAILTPLFKKQGEQNDEN